MQNVYVCLQSELNEKNSIYNIAFAENYNM